MTAGLILGRRSRGTEVDLGAGLLLSWQRWASGGWGAPAATHVVANLVAVLR